MKLIKDFILILCGIILMNACSKNEKHEEVRSIVLEEPYFVDYDKAEFNINFVTERKNNEQFNYIGICWDTKPNPTYYYDNTNIASFSVEEYIEKESGSASLTANNLYANTTYYARAFIEEVDDDYDDNNDYFYSTQVTFTTDAMIPAPCTVGSNQIDFSGNPENMTIGNLFHSTPNDPHVEFETSSSLGDFRVIFPHEPFSGVYRTVQTSGIGYPDSRDILITGHIAETFNCEYLADADQYVYVDNDGNGNVSISFCNLKFRTQDACTNLHELTGEINNY